MFNRAQFLKLGAAYPEAALDDYANSLAYGGMPAHLVVDPLLDGQMIGGYAVENAFDGVSNPWWDRDRQNPMVDYGSMPGVSALGYGIADYGGGAAEYGVAGVGSEGDSWSDSPQAEGGAIAAAAAAAAAASKTWDQPSGQPGGDGGGLSGDLINSGWFHPAAQQPGNVPAPTPVVTPPVVGPAAPGAHASGSSIKWILAAAAAIGGYFLFG